MNPTAIISVVEAIVRAFARRKAIKNKVLPLIEEAAKIASSDAAATNESRRDWVVAALMKEGLPESTARLLTEAGVKLWKKLEAKKAKKAAKS
jgi:hypothetical protein